MEIDRYSKPNIALCLFVRQQPRSIMINIKDFGVARILGAGMIPSTKLCGIAFA
jgi:hypothetical protein